MPWKGAHAGDDAPSPVRPTKMQIIVSLVLLLGWLPLLGFAVEENGSVALLKFKSSLANVDASFPKWDTNVQPCSGYRSNWGGVLCFDGYVWGLQLENMSLQGQIDVGSLVHLRFLRTLSFKNNQFQGQMPDWRNLGALKSLFLSNNRFSGEIPRDAFKGMTSLKKVDLANNQFTGQIPSSLQSPKLIQLKLENNRFTGKIPAISSEHLKVLNVSNNQLDGPIPANLQNLDPSSFLGNKGLCGKPLLTSCNPLIPSPDLEPFLHSSPPTSSSPPAPTSSQNKFSTALMIIFIILGLIVIVLLILICMRSRRSPSPRLGREGSAPYNEKGLPVGAAAATASPCVGEQSSGADLMRASAEVLGSGNFGASYKAVLVDGEPLVVKRFKLMNNVAKEDFHEHMRRIGRLKHPNLLPLVAYFYRKEEKLLVFDYVYNGSLHGELPSLSLPHGHLKSSNVLLDKNFNPLLMDYSLAPVVNPNQVHQVLLAYQSPEYFQIGKRQQ